MRFTREEFDTMVQELLYSSSGRSDMLCIIAEKTLMPSVRSWCYNDEFLRNRGHEGDIMQEIHLRLMQNVVMRFLLRDGIEGPYNDDPEGFEDWMFRVALNIQRDYASRVRGRTIKTDQLDETSCVDVCTVTGITEETAARIERLTDAFHIVLSSDASVYKILTWLAHFVFILEHDVPKFRSNDLVIHAFEDKTLFEMYDMLLCAAGKIPWIQVTEAQHEKISAALRKKHHGDVLYGEIKYRDFFMKQNGEPSGKKSVSDWMNRMNGMLRRKEEEAATAISNMRKGSPDHSRDEERRSKNGASDG